MSEENSSIEIKEISQFISSSLNNSVSSIKNINSDIHHLSFITKIQASHLGNQGGPFSVIADNIKILSTTMNDTTEILENDILNASSKMTELSDKLAIDTRGEIQAKNAFNMIDVIDRNLYERSCDIRWWAKDLSIINGVLEQSNEARIEAAKRLSFILDAYTVYHDIILCSPEGEIVSRGKEKEFSYSPNQKSNKWFQQAMNSNDPDDYFFSGLVTPKVVDEKKTLIYSAPIIDNGTTIGVLAVLFNWADLADYICNMTAENNDCHAFIVDRQSNILSHCNRGDIKHLPIKDIVNKISTEVQGYFSFNNKLISYANSTGYETYKTGWIAVTLEDMI